MAKVMKTMDGNTAAAYVAYAFTDVAAIYPITPSSSMAENVDEWSAHGQKNLFGQQVKVVEMQSEAGAAGAVHGSLATGALTTTFTASQGLLLMIPNMYKISGELLPGVFHVSARALAGHALSIFGDHSDVMATRQTGFAMLASGSVQEIMDLAGVAHLASIKGRVPFMHFFDGFRSSSEVQKIETIDYKDLDNLLDKDAVKAFRNNALNPAHPVTRGTAQNPDIFFQAKEASNLFYDAIPAIVEDYMKDIGKVTGRAYNLFDYYGAADADRVIIAMGSITETTEETVDYLNANGEKVGVLKVRLYRPFSIKHFLKAMPATATKIAVLDRTKEPGSIGDPLYMDICNAYFEENKHPLIVGGRYGLGSKDTTPAQIKAVYDNLKSESPKNHFTMGIVDDVTFTSIPNAEIPDTTPKGTKQCKFWGLGADGTVGANKAAVKIIGDNTDMYAQAYFSYDSKKSGGITVSHLRFGHKPIKSTYLINNADYVACHNPSYVDKYDMVSDIKPGGTFLLNCGWSVEEMDEKLPAAMKKYLAVNNINFYTLDGIQIAKDLGLGGRINMVMQSAFFKLTDIIPMDDAVKYLKDAIKKAYGSKGDKIVEMNYKAVDMGIESCIKVEIPKSWKTAVDGEVVETDVPDFIKNIMVTVNAQKGDSLPVSAFKGIEDGTFPMGTAAYEKRGIAVDVPEWQKEQCIQCNQCAYVCPHAVIRPFLMNEEEMANAPEGFEAKKTIGKGLDGLSYRIQISPLDCTGCGSCANTCPAKVKALVMKPIETELFQTKYWDYAINLPEKSGLGNINTVKFSQFEKPLLEFSGACAGCGETPYAKLVTQMFGDRMLIANATGCSSIWGGSAPATPYTVNSKGYGPAWANSLFEDNAEYGLGMHLGMQQIRGNIVNSCEAIQDMNISDNLKVKAKAWVENKEEAALSKLASVELLTAIEAEEASGDAKDELKNIVEKKDFLVKKSQWIFGGDGWAYDIGYGGLDHVLASGEDVNVMVFDTEVYSNTGGQASKATPTGSVAKFAASGKTIRKKDLGLMAMSYGYVYVAQIAMGANQAQCIKAIAEAEAYKGPSLIIAYAPCINHGIKGGLGCSQQEEKKAVEAGYWHLYKYNPDLKLEGKNPFSLDSKEPTASYQDFIVNETRYSSLTRTFPDIAKKLFKIAEEDSKERLNNYKRLADNE